MLKNINIIYQIADEIDKSLKIHCYIRYKEIKKNNMVRITISLYSKNVGQTYTTQQVVSNKFLQGESFFKDCAGRFVSNFLIAEKNQLIRQKNQICSDN